MTDMEKTIEIPEGYEARIEGNKVIIEPKESEDERIRKALLGHLKECRNQCRSEVMLGEYAEWLAYLERQKERGPLSKDEEYTLARIIEYLEDNDCPSEWKYLLHDVYSLPYQKERQPAMIQWTGNNLKEIIDFTGKSPKFDEWFKSWDDFENYVHTHNDILKLFCEDGSHYEVPIGAWIVKTPDGFNTPSLFKFIQKPTECSEEEIVNWAYDNFRVSSFDMTKIVTDFSSMDELEKSLRERLKSFRSQPHWKPNEEQMEALFTSISVGSFGHRKALKSLYADLKKLSL